MRRLIAGFLLVLGGCQSVELPTPSFAPPSERTGSQTTASATTAPQPTPSVPSSSFPRPPAASATPRSTAAEAGTFVFGLEFGDANGASSLATVEPDGSGFALLTERAPEGTRYESPAWFPDGNRIVYDLEDATGSRLFTMDPRTGQSTLIDTGELAAKEPVVSPDGSQIVFRGSVFMGFHQDLERTALYSIEFGGSNLKKLTDPPKDGAGDTGPDFSPDGSQIVFARNGALEVMNADGTKVHELLPADTQVWRPRWSPDGQHIVFGVNGGDLPEIVLMVNADGSGLAKPVTSPTCCGGSPSWSPDGDTIVFTFWTPHTIAELETMRPDGTGRTTLWKGEMPGDFPFEAAWRPS